MLAQSNKHYPACCSAPVGCTLRYPVACEIRCAYCNPDRSLRFLMAEPITCLCPSAVQVLCRCCVLCLKTITISYSTSLVTHLPPLIVRNSNQHSHRQRLLSDLQKEELVSLLLFPTVKNGAYQRSARAILLLVLCQLKTLFGRARDSIGKPGVALVGPPCMGSTL